MITSKDRQFEIDNRKIGVHANIRDVVELLQYNTMGAIACPLVLGRTGSSQDVDFAADKAPKPIAAITADTPLPALPPAAITADTPLPAAPAAEMALPPPPAAAAAPAAKGAPLPAAPAIAQASLPAPPTSVNDEDGEDEEDNPFADEAADEETAVYEALYKKKAASTDVELGAAVVAGLLKESGADVKVLRQVWNDAKKAPDVPHGAKGKMNFNEFVVACKLTVKAGGNFASSEA